VRKEAAMSNESRHEHHWNEFSLHVDWHIPEEMKSQSASPIFRTITGALVDGKRLARPLTVMIEYDDEEVVVSEPVFHMHASASTEAEALAAFRRIFSGYLDVLTARENRLDPYLRKQLAYLRSYIVTE
jgi:hypothetical protein